MSGETLIVGAGPAGLAGAFWRLQEDPDRRITVIEAAPRAGGWVKTEHVGGFACEIGPQAIRPGDELDALVHALEIDADLRPAAESAKARFIGRGGKLLPVPMGPGQLISTKLFTFGGKLRLLREPFTRKGDPTRESVTSFAARRFGKQTAPLVQTVVSGIFAGDADALEMESAFPLMATCEREHGSVFSGMKAHFKARKAARGGAPRPKRAPLYSFRGGMSGLITRLEQAVGDRLRVASPARSVTHRDGRWVVTLENGEELAADELVLATPARVSAELLASLDAELSADLAAIPFASLANVYLGYEHSAVPADLPLQGFGFLLDPGEKSAVLGTLYCSSLFPDHAPEGQALLRVMIGGARHPEAVEFPDEQLVDIAVGAVRSYAGLAGPFPFVKVVKVRDAVPQYPIGHAERMVRIEERLTRHPGLSLRGNSYRAVALAGQLGRDSGTDAAGGEAASSGAAERAETAPAR